MRAGGVNRVSGRPCTERPAIPLGISPDRAVRVSTVLKKGSRRSIVPKLHSGSAHNVNSRCAKGRIASLAMAAALGALGPDALAQTAVSLSAPPNNALYALPATVTLKAAAAATAPASVARVEFYANGALIGTDTTRAFSFVWANPVPGTYSLTAIAYDIAGGQTASAARTVTVAAGNQP